MPTEIKLPELGENVDSGILIKVLVSPGQRVAKDEPLLELETEKANIEVPSPFSGEIKQVLVQKGQTVKVGQPLFVIEEAAAPPAKQIVAQEEDKVPAEEKPAKTVEPAAAARIKEQGAATEAERAEPAMAEPATLPAGRQQPEKPAPAPPSAPVETPGAGQPVLAAPAIRRLARELGIDIHKVPGSGAGGRVSEEDVKNYARRVISAISADGSAVCQPRLPDFSKWGDIERQPMTNVRRRTAEHLFQAWRTVPQVTEFDQADITELEKIRKQFSAAQESGGAKITITAIAVKIVAFALQKFPEFGSSVDFTAGEIIYKKYCHIGVAVDTSHGLIVPVIRDAGRKSIPRIAAELADLSLKAREKRLSIEEVSGGVFTITNLGGIGGTGFSPIVNYPEVAILGLSHASLQPKHFNGTFQQRLILPLSLSFDHRAADGAGAARFLRWIAEAFEQPALLLFAGPPA